MWWLPGTGQKWECKLLFRIIATFWDARKESVMDGGDGFECYLMPVWMYLILLNYTLKKG